MIMGVTGSGKTTVGEALARRLGWEFADADDFHSASNKRKIHEGVALTDADREPWLLALHGRVAEWILAGRDAVLACSALKDTYRRTIAEGDEPRVVYLKGTYEFIAARLAQRHGHFAGVSILASQFEALEEPGDAAVTVELESAAGARTAEEIVDEIVTRLRLA